MSAVHHNLNKIEMFGFPGAGKTTLQNCLYSKGYLDIEFISPARIQFYFTVYYSLLILFRMFVSSPKDTLKFLKDKQSRRLLLKLGLRTGVQNKQMATKITKNVLLQDSGLIMPLISALVEEGWNGSKERIQLIFSSVPLPVTAIFVSTDPVVAHGRYHERNSQSRDIDINVFVQIHYLINFIIKDLMSNGVNVVTVKNDDNIDCKYFLSIIQGVINK